MLFCDYDACEDVYAAGAAFGDGTWVIHVRDWTTVWPMAPEPTDVLLECGHCAHLIAWHEGVPDGLVD